MQRNSVSGLAMAALVISGLAQAQQPPSSGANEQPGVGRVSIPGSNYDIVFGAVEPGVHLLTHRQSPAGVVILYLSEGEISYLVDGQAVKTYKVGNASATLESAFPQEGGRNSAPARTAVYIVERNGQSDGMTVRSSQ